MNPIDPIFGSIGVTGGFLSDTIFSALNYAQQKKNLEYMHRLQNRIFRREDNAVQRRVADLRLAGLSPVLAAGVGAQAGPVVNTTPPQFSNMPKMGDAIMSVFDMMKMKQDISISKADQARIEKETELAESRIKGQNIDNLRKGHNLKIEADTGSHTDPSQVGKSVRDMTNWLKNATEAVKTGVKKAVKYEKIR